MGKTGHFENMRSFKSAWRYLNKDPVERVDAEGVQTRMFVSNHNGKFGVDENSDHKANPTLAKNILKIQAVKEGNA